MKRIKPVLILALLAAVLVLAACGGTAAAEPEPTDTPEPTATPEPTPLPTPEPPSNLEAGDTVTVNAVLLESGSVVLDGIQCVRADEFVSAIGGTLERDGDGLTFTWRDSPVSLTVHDKTGKYGEKEFTLETAVFLYDNQVYVPVESLCDGLEIGVFRDDEYAHLYCTPGSGNWELEDGRTVPVLMYHSMSANWNGNEALVVRPPQFRLQLEMFAEEGYQCIWFSDLVNLDQYDKPIILTFDDGYLDNYTELLPILEEYNVKATFFVVTRDVEHPHGQFMSEENLLECIDSGLVEIQSHTVNHNYLSSKSAEDLDYELSESKLLITRITGKEPFVLAYPCGQTSTAVYEATPEYYRFAVKMIGKLWVTGEDSNVEIYRVPVFKGVTVDHLRDELDGTYPMS